MKNSFMALLASRKFIALLLASIVGIVMVLTHNLPIDQLLKFIGGGTLFLIGAIAHEDAAEKSAGGASVVGTLLDTTSPAPAPAPENTAASLMKTVAAALITAAETPPPAPTNAIPPPPPVPTDTGAAS